MALRTSLQKLFVLVSVVCLLGFFSPTVSAVEPVRFNVSANSGAPGLKVRISQADPCPSGTQYVKFFFTDAAGKEYPSQTMSIEGGPDWLGAFDFTIPYKGIYGLNPMVFYNQEAAMGMGKFRVQCLVYENSTLVAREYQPQPFTVTGPSLRFTTGGKISPKQNLVINSVNPCPAPASSVSGMIGNDSAYYRFSAAVNAVTGMWSTTVTIPETISNVMGSPIPTPLGKYWVRMTCMDANIAVQYYADEVLEIVEAPALYVALGDSMSSGEGTFEYIDTGNSCHRSKLGYPYYVDEKLNLGKLLHAACGGAVTDDFYNANPKNAGEPAQLSNLTADTKVVTLTIGGNDVGFESVLQRCVNHILNKGWGCSNDKKLRQSVSRKFATLAGKANETADGRKIHSFFEVYQSVHAQAPNAKVYVGGYAHLFGQKKRFYTKKSDAPSDAACYLPILTSVDYEDAQWINKKTDELNGLIQAAVDKARRQGIQIEYVPAILFSGHSLCDSDEPWLNDVLLNFNTNPPTPMPESLHPTSVGYEQGYGLAFEVFMKK